MHRILVLLTSFTSLLLATARVSAFLSEAPILNPKNYVSPSGEFVLNVDPTDLYGRGEGNYRVTKNGVLVWSGTKPFTLYDAGITDKGLVGGYAYINGVEGTPKERSKDRPGEFHVVIMRATGEIILDDVIKRTPSRFLHASPNPLAKGVIVDGAKAQLVVIVNDEDLNRSQDRWWTYQLSSGKLLSKSTTGPAISHRPSKKSAPEVKPLDVGALPNRALRELGRFTLPDKASPSISAIRDIVHFDLDDRGRIGFIRQETPKQYAFVLIAPTGKVLWELKLRLPAETLRDDSPKTAWVGGEQWVIVASNHAVGGKASAWWLNASTGNIEPLSEFKSPPVSHVAGCRDGGFVALTVTRHQYSMEDTLIAFDKAGKARWQIKEDYTDGKALFSPKDVAVTTSAEIAVLDNIRKAIQFFSNDGKFIRTHELEKAWGRKPNYPSEIAADENAGILIKDFNGTPPLIRMDRSGKVTAQISPKHSNGRTIDAIRGVKVASDRIWACDGECFIRLREDGLSDLVLGRAPTEESLGKIAALTVDQRGRLYAADERTGTIHVFDQTGTALQVFKPDIADFKSKLLGAQIAVKGDGTVYLNDNFSSKSIIQFAADGQRLGKKRFALDEVTEQWFAFPTGREILVIGYHDAFIVDDDGKVRRTIQRRPDNNWLELPDRASVSADGSFAILTRGGGYWRKTPWDVNLYEPAGDPVRIITLPALCMDFCFVYTGRHLATRTDTDVCLFSASGEPILKFSPEWKDFKTERCECFAPFDGRELWFVAVDRKSVCRFALP